MCAPASNRSCASIVEGTNKDDEQVLVGLFGPTEIPFVVHNVKGEWRVEAEPYYMLLLG